MPGQSLPERPVGIPNRTRSLSFALGVSEILFLLGLFLLALGLWLRFGAGISLSVTGAVLIGVSIFNAKQA